MNRTIVTNVALMATEFSYGIPTIASLYLCKIEKAEEAKLQVSINKEATTIGVGKAAPKKKGSRVLKVIRALRARQKRRDRKALQRREVRRETITRVMATLSGVVKGIKVLVGFYIY
jgi:hypothetical protein